MRYSSSYMNNEYYIKTVLVDLALEQGIGRKFGIIGVGIMF